MTQPAPAAKRRADSGAHGAAHGSGAASSTPANPLVDKPATVDTDTDKAPAWN